MHSSPELKTTTMSPVAMRPITRSPKRAVQVESNDEGDQLEALTEVDNHVQFASETLQRADLTAAARHELHSQMAKIQQRRNDPNLYLAVIGEFSSGKSTLINALLSDELLKTSALVTTAAATRIRHGDDLAVQVTFDAPRHHTVQADGRTGRITLPDIPGVDGLDLRQFIETVTSDDSVASQVADITITHPAPFLADSTVIIDTPGTNAINRAHGAITHRVVESEADAALVIIPATVPLSQTLLEFLRGPLRPYLHRCIFVVTRMDQIPPRQQTMLLKNVQERLAFELEIEPPALCCCSAQVVMNHLMGEAVREDLARWLERFTEFAMVVTDRLRHERVLSIAESLLRLLRSLFEQLDSHLQREWERYREREAAIKRETIRDLDSFAQEQHTAAGQKINGARAHAGRALEQGLAAHRQKTTEVLRAHVFKAASVAALNAVISDQVEKTLASNHQRLEEDVQRIIGTLTSATAKAGVFFDKQCAEQYRRLKALGSKVTLHSEAFTNGSMSVNPAQVIVSARRMNEGHNAQYAKLETGGAIGGAIIGSFIMPGVGTLIGIFVGSFLSDWFGPSLDERKQQVWNQLNSSLDAYFNTIRSAALAALESCARQAQAALDQHIDAYIAKYAAVVKAMLDEQQNELRRLNALQRTMQRDLSEIGRRRAAVASRQERMAAVSSFTFAEF